MKFINKYLLATLSLSVIALVAYFYILKPLQRVEVAAKKTLPQKATAINYEGAMVLNKLEDINDIINELESAPTAGAGTFDLATMSATITSEALKAFSDSKERALPLVSHWNVQSDAMDPMYMFSRIESGEHILVSWKLDPYYNDSIGSDYYEESIKKAAKYKLPLVFVLPAPESALTKDNYYFGLDKKKNPNVVKSDASILAKLSPFGPNDVWNEVGKQWASTSLMAQIQEWYPNPPLVVFVSQDEANKLSWSDIETASRYTGTGDDNFKRTLVGAEWIEKYRQIHEGFKKGFNKTAWKKNVKFVTRNKFSDDLGKKAEWINNATITNNYMNIWPLTADSATVDFDLSGSKTDKTANAPHIVINNLPFMLKEAKFFNPTFSYQLNLNTNSKVSDPAQYRGLTQFALWFLRPSVVRQSSNATDRESLAPMFQEVADSVELIHYNPQLADFWRNGELVKSGDSDLNKNIPEQYANDPRWFLLDADTNPSRPWTDETEIPVWSFALVKGEAPNREWLVYVQSPDGNKSDVTVSVPGYKDILVDSSVLGSFYLLTETTNNISSPIKKNIKIINYTKNGDFNNDLEHWNTNDRSVILNNKLQLHSHGDMANNWQVIDTKIGTTYILTLDINTNLLKSAVFIRENTQNGAIVESTSYKGEGKISLVFTAKTDKSVIYLRVFGEKGRNAFATFDNIELISSNQVTRNNVKVSLEKNFKIYDSTLYINKLAFNKVNFPPINIIYSSALWSGKDMTEPDEKQIIKVALGLEYTKEPYIIDIEHWNVHTDDSELAEENIQKYIFIIDTMKKTRPDLSFGYYGVLPNRDYWNAISNDSEKIRKWDGINERLKKLANYVDVICPTIYTFYNDREGWVKYAKANIKRAKSYGKPVYTFLWPQYHQSNSQLNGQFVDDEFWKLQLAVARDSDSIIIWGGWGDNGPVEWDNNASWWRILKAFLAK